MNELLVIYSIGCLVSLISVLAVCVCGCRKGTTKNDMLGLDGMVKITNPDENVNHLPAVSNHVSQSAVENYVSESDEHSKRPSGGSNPHRSLPDIPVLASDNGANGDTSSELYATVDDKTASIAYNKRHTLPNGLDTGPSLSHQSSISQSDSNYARLKENPYDKVKKSENPYANVKPSNNKTNYESSIEPSPQSSWNNIARVTDSIEIDERVDETILEHNSQNVTSGSHSPIPDIQAATAVAGRVAASQDLPYMTPPITQPQHFSGDSQDSSRGYTSISVREPLANIMNQTLAIRRRTDIDPHYSTVSDDSDEMYAAIVEPNSNIYNGSETYAQIQPITIAVDVHGQSSNTYNETQEHEEDDQYEPAPQPPSVDSLKHVAHVHSRQASSSSCTSSVANLGSPKPEKRQANSPLPPPPAISPDLYSRIDKNNEESPNNNNNLTIVRNVEDMYAKVHKNKKKIDLDESEPNTLQTKPTELSKKNSSSIDDIKNLDALSIHSHNSDTDKSKKATQEHCYETLNKDKTKNNSWQNNSGPASLLSNDPGYEQLNRAPSESDPNYEVLRPQRTASVCDTSLGYSTIGQTALTVNSPVPEDGYSIVNKNKKTKSDPGYEDLENKLMDEPTYESMPSHYATVNKSESESDPNYESVKYLNSETEPPYERLQDDENAKGSIDLSEYEQITSNKNSDCDRSKESSKTSDQSEDPSSGTPEPEYQRIKSSETSEDYSDKSTINEYETEISVQQPSIILTVTSDITEVKINIPNNNVAKEITETTDVFHV